jgi:hypothetical protein
MRSSAIDIREAVFSQDAIQVAFTGHGDVVQAFAANTAQKSLAERIHERRFRGGTQDSDARSLGGPVEVRTELVVVFADDEPRSVAERRRLA